MRSILIALALLANTSSAFAIVGGTEANLREHPWQVRLSTADGHLCGGTLLNANWVLTAAHCFMYDPPSTVTVTLGDHRWNSSDGTEQVRTIAQYTPHPHFDTAWRNDIALIRLSSPVTFTSAVQPLELAVGDYYGNNTTMTISGWGLTAASAPSEPDVLMDATIPLRSDVTCDAEHTWMTMSGSMMCGGTPGRSGVSSGCSGDGGGPLVVDDPVLGKRLVGVFSQASSTCQHYSIATRVRDFVPWIESVIATRPPVCSGRTAPGITTWVQHDSHTVYTDIDTRACNWGSTPLYFTTLGGNGGIYPTDGVTSIYDATANNFRVYVKSHGAISPLIADASRWHINWASVANNTNVAGVCSGRSATNTWVQYNADSIYMDVNTSSCGFTATPSYFTSLSGTSAHSATVGATSIYSPTATGFRVYVKKSGVTPTYAADRSWRVLWRAEPASVNYEDVCNGKTVAGSTSWVQHNANTVYVDVNTSTCDVTTTPKYFTSLGGWSQHFDSNGATSIHSPTDSGFRIYVEHTGITPSEANDRRWHIVWNARP